LSSLTNWNGPDNQFVTCTLEGGGGWWWGTDNDGLWHYSLDAKPGYRWQHYRAEDGLYDDSITALCLDRLGRLWVGTERRGVSVFNSSWWQNYDIMSGPLGVHVTTIVLNPLNGDIWIGSDCGLSIYSEQTKSWRYITEFNGLPSDAINCIAFTSEGTALVGSADDGILVSDPSSHYSSWTTINATPASQSTETGLGLPSNQINCLLINKAGKIYCGTSSGLAFSNDNGNTWNYLHGYKWQLKIKQDVRNAIPLNPTSVVLPLSDDYISALAYDKNGYLYIGHRQGGFEVIDDSDGSQLYHTRLDSYGTDIRSLTLLSSNGLLIGNYGTGASTISWTTEKIYPEVPPIKARTIVAFPLPAAPLTVNEISADAKKLTKIGVTPGQGTGYYLGEDWQTQGNWTQRYGTEYAILCGAEDANQDYVSGDVKDFSVTNQLGMALNGSTTPSHWLQWDQSGDPRVLFDPETGSRRESEWDDQGEQDERMIQGPDIWLTVTVPVGVHRLCLYFMNKDGHTTTTRFRDYIIQLMPAVTGVDYHQTYDVPTEMPAVAETRVENFWPGVYERFALIGPGTFYVKIDRNYSLNTIIQGIFIDSLSTEQPISTTRTSATKINSPAVVSSAVQLWSTLNGLYGSPASGPAQRTLRIELLRTISDAGASKTLVTSWRHALGLWNDEDWANLAKNQRSLIQPAIVGTNANK